MPAAHPTSVFNANWFSLSGRLLLDATNHPTILINSLSAIEAGAVGAQGVYRGHVGA
jgi:hypothetical protein